MRLQHVGCRLTLAAALAACGARARPPCGADEIAPPADVALWVGFTPCADAARIELAAIAAVTSARRGDRDGPADRYAIRYAVYNLTDHAITVALVDARAAGVDVAIVIESDQLDPARTWNDADDRLVAGGFVSGGAGPDRTATLVAARGGGLMHLKTRTFRWRDRDGRSRARLIDGSGNPNGSVAANEETVMVSDDPRLVDAYDAKVDAVRRGARLDAPPVVVGATELMFLPEHAARAAERIRALIDAEPEAITVAMFALRDVWAKDAGGGLVEHLVAAHRRGVEIVIVTDRQQSDGHGHEGQRWRDDPADERLVAAGIPIVEAQNDRTAHSAMHHKYAVFGRARPIVVTGTANWTEAALGLGRNRPNQESLLVIDTARLDGGRTGRRFLDNHRALLARYGAAAPRTTKVAPDPRSRRQK